MSFFWCIFLMDKNFKKIDEACHFIPSGMNVWEGRKERFDLLELRCYRSLKDSKRLERSLGTLGGGNHFIEIDRAEDGTQYLVIHSGSRNLGKQVAEYYQNLAVELNASSCAFTGFLLSVGILSSENFRILSNTRTPTDFLPANISSIASYTGKFLICASL